MDAETVIDTMLTCVSGQIVGCNVAAGVDNRLIAPRIASTAFEWLGRLAAARGYRTAQDLVDTLRVLRNGVYPPSISGPPTPPKFRLRGESALDAHDIGGDLSVVLPARLLNKLILQRDIERLRREGLVFPSSATGPFSGATVARWRRLPAADRSVRFDPYQTMGEYSRVVWFTRRRDLEASLDSTTPHDHAQRVRDRLGLVHHERGVELAAMHFPAEIFQSTTSARPSFLDASDHRRFRTLRDGLETRLNRQWGCTVDLAALARLEPSADGCPERVTEEIAGDDLPDGGRFEFELLGPVAVSTGGDPSDDVAFSARLRSQLGGLSVDDLRAKLKSYL